MRRGLWIWLLATLVLLGAVVLGRGVMVESMQMSSADMAPTIQPGATLTVDKLTILVRPPNRGDVVAFRSPDTGELVANRVIGLGGDTLRQDRGTLFRNDIVVSEAYVSMEAGRGPDFGPVTVGRDQIFVLADNRAGSPGPRRYGAIAVDQVVGRILAGGASPQRNGRR